MLFNLGCLDHLQLKLCAYPNCLEMVNSVYSLYWKQDLIQISYCHFIIRHKNLWVVVTFRVHDFRRQSWPAGCPCLQDPLSFTNFSYQTAHADWELQRPDYYLNFVALNGFHAAQQLHHVSFITPATKTGSHFCRWSSSRFVKLDSREVHFVIRWIHYCLMHLSIRTALELSG